MLLVNGILVGNPFFSIIAYGLALDVVVIRNVSDFYIGLLVAAFYNQLEVKLSAVERQGGVLEYQPLVEYGAQLMLVGILNGNGAIGNLVGLVNHLFHLLKQNVVNLLSRFAWRFDGGLPANLAVNLWYCTFCQVFGIWVNS